MAETRRRKAEAAPAEDAIKAAPKPAKAQVPVKTDMVFRRRLEQGDHGPAVKEIQRLLSLKGLWEGPQDGRYGTLLARAVRKFQGERGLKVNGEVDVRTWQELTA